MAEYIRGTARSTASINDELEKIQNSLADKLDRKPSSGQPNEMVTDLDMNGNRIYNLPEPQGGQDAVSKDYVDKIALAGLPVNLGNDKEFQVLSTALNDVTLEVNDTVTVLGRNTVNDGGGARYLVVAGGTGVEDGGSYHDLVNGLQLKLISKHNQLVFGVTGSGFPVDDGAQLNKYADYCRSQGATLRLVAPTVQLIYTTETIDFTGIHVKGDFPATINFGATPSNMNFITLTGIPTPRPSVSTVYTDSERLPTEGICIFSDVATTVVEASSDYVLQGFGVSGWLETVGQVCIRDPYTVGYRGVAFDWKDLWVTGSGGDGIALENGIEVCRWINVKSNYNNGYGVTTAGGGGDDNQEYFECYNCEFRVNRLDGFLMANFRKGVKFEFCNGNSNGWYGLGASAVGKPADIRFIRGLVRIQGVQTFGAANLKIKDCYSEDCARFATFELDNPLKGLELTGNYSIPTLGLSDTGNDLFYFYDNGISQLRNLIIKNNNIQDGTRGKIFNGDVVEADFVDAEIGYVQTTDYDLSSITQLVSNKKDFQEEVKFSKHLQTGSESIGDGTANTFTSNYILNSLRDVGQGNNSHAQPTCYLLTSNWQATNSNSGGAYLIWAYRAANSEVKGNVMEFGESTGFVGAPSVGTDGVLSVQLASAYRAKIIRLDMNGYKA